MSHTYEYARPSVTVDVVIVTREAVPRVLLIRRKKEPFAGAWAIPGGFVDPGETLAAAAARELREETGVEDVGAGAAGRVWRSRPRPARLDGQRCIPGRSCRPTRQRPPRTMQRRSAGTCSTRFPSRWPSTTKRFWRERGPGSRRSGPDRHRLANSSDSVFLPSRHWRPAVKCPKVGHSQQNPTSATP